MTTHVKDTVLPNTSGTNTFTASVTSTAGHTLVLGFTAWMTGNVPVHISSITDSAGNTWVFSTSTSNQNPPANGSFSSNFNQYGFTCLATCIGAAAITSVTVTTSASVTSFAEGAVSEFSSLPAGAVVLGGASSGTLAAVATSYTTPSVSAASASAVLVVVYTSNFGTWTGVTSGYTLLSVSDPIAAYNTAATAGSVSATFTQSTGSDVPSSAIVVIGAPGAHTATAALTVTPTFGATPTRGHSRTASLTVTPVLSAAPVQALVAGAALTVTPALSATGTGGAPALTATASLTVTPVLSASPVQAIVTHAALTVTPSFSATPAGSGTPTIPISLADLGGAADSISVQVSLAVPQADVAGAVDSIKVVKYLLPPVPSQAGMQALNPNPSFAGGTDAGWAPSGGSAVISASPPAGCPTAYAAQFTASTSGGAYEGSPSPIPTVTGIGYLVTAWVWSSSGQVQIGFDWLNSAGAYISTSTTTISIPSGTWVQVFYAAPGGTAIPATAARFYQRIGPAASGDYTWMTDVLVTAQMPSSLAPASPVFVTSQMPRMHIQNLLTRQWIHRDVQGITGPSITWNLNNPDTFSCTLAPARPDLLDSTGNPIMQEWRDVIYLEESDQIRFGGIITASQRNEPGYQLTATGFACYPTGTPYTGPSVTQYGVDALDAVRYLWQWMQTQPYANLGMALDSTESGYLLGNAITNLASTTLARDAAAGQPYIWVGGAAGLSSGMRVTINGVAYTIKTVLTSNAGVATGEVQLNSNLGEKHSNGELLLQVQTWTTLARDAASGAKDIWVYDASGFTSGQVILIGTSQNPAKPTESRLIQTVVTNSAGVATGDLQISPPLSEAHYAGEQIVLAPTPYQLVWSNTTDCGQEIQSIQQEAVFDYRETHTWTGPAKTDVLHRLSFGVPRIGTRQSTLRFAEGENIIVPVTVTRDGTQFADQVVGLGSGSGNAMLRSTVTQGLGQRLTRTQVYQDATVLTTARLSAKAQKQLAAAANMDSPTQVVIKNHPNAPFGSFSVGDDIPVIMATGWRQGLIWCRITSMTQDPTTDLMTLTTARSDSFSYQQATGQNGTI